MSWRTTESEARPRHHWVAHQRPTPASSSPDGPARTAALSIYEDRTLRRGDAVMTARGLRIFEGSATFPYLPSDFSPLDTAVGVKRSLRKSLSLYDHQVPLPQEFADAPAMTIHLDPGNRSTDTVAAVVPSGQPARQDGGAPPDKTTGGSNKD